MDLRIRASTIVYQNNSLLTFLGVDPNDGREFFFLPGGQVQNHETTLEAAARETLEETGYQVRVDAEPVEELEYQFYWNGQTHDCLTFFYRAYLLNPLQSAKPVNDASYNKKVIWLPREKIVQGLSYHSEICRIVLKLIS